MARVRSPNYPALSLPDAVARVRDVHKAQQTTAEPRDVVVKHMGYGSTNGRALKSLSALVKYGLLEKDGSDGLKVSDRAMSILFPEDQVSKNLALRSAAMEPALYAGIFERWEGRPSEDSLNAYLIRNGFNANSVDGVARAFYETYDLVSNIEDSHDSGDDEPEDEEHDIIVQEQEKQKQKQKQGGGGGGAAARLPVMDPVLNSTKPKFDFESVEILTIIDNKDDLEELLMRLELIKDMLPSKAEH